MLYLGIQSPVSREQVYQVAKVASAYDADFFVIGATDFPLPDETMRFDTLVEAQRSLIGDFVRIVPSGARDVTGYLAPESAVFVLGGAQDGLTAISVGTPTGEALEDAVAAAVVLHDYTFAGAGARMIAKSLGLVS